MDDPRGDLLFDRPGEPRDVPRAPRHLSYQERALVDAEWIRRSGGELGVAVAEDDDHLTLHARTGNVQDHMLRVTGGQDDGSLIHTMERLLRAYAGVLTALLDLDDPAGVRGSAVVERYPNGNPCGIPVHVLVAGGNAESNRGRRAAATSPGVCGLRARM